MTKAMALIVIVALPFILAPIVIQKVVAALTPPFAEDFNTAGTGDPTTNGHWTFSNTWTGGGTTLTVPSGPAENIAVMTAGQTTTADQCVCSDIVTRGDVPGFALLRASGADYDGTPDGTNDGYVCGWWSGNSRFFIWEYDGRLWESDLFTTVDTYGTFSAGDRACCSVVGAGASRVWRIWYYDSGAGGGSTCGTATCVAGSGTGHGCTATLTTGSSPTVSDTNTYCGLGTQQEGTVYDNWTCDDYP